MTCTCTEKVQVSSLTLESTDSSVLNFVEILSGFAVARNCNQLPENGDIEPL